MTLYDGLPLFDQVTAAKMRRRRTPPEAPFVVESDTSRQAAEDIRPDATRLAEQILAWIRACGPRGATCDELEIGMELLHQTASSRIRFLVIDGRLRDSRLRRETRRGKAATVWIAGGDMIPRNGKEATP